MIRRSLALAGFAVGMAAVIDRALARALPHDERPSARAIRSLAVVDAPLDAVWAAIWDERLVPPVLPELGALVQRPILGRIFQDDLHRFRELVETGAWTPGRV